MTRLSVNINKLATLRNARGGNNPDILKSARDIQRFGADGITVHPRPDERHIRYDDVRALKHIVHTELNIEGNPIEKKFVDLVLEILPTQVTLVPDTQGQLTSDHGWDTIRYQDFLKDIITEFKKHGIRTSIFIDPNPSMIPYAQQTGTDRVELYTEFYAREFANNPQGAIAAYVQTAQACNAIGLQMNAGHDLNLQNIGYFIKHIPSIQEVSIGHALICDALYLGLENTIQMYKRAMTVN
jgi:pyridoxine 5'-phosphate synthase (EC 2.6.99.2)